jgi:hypothetical protein
MVYPALLPLMRTPRLIVVDRNDVSIVLGFGSFWKTDRQCIKARSCNHRCNGKAINKAYSVDYWHSRGVRISGSNAGYTMFRGSVKGTGYPLHSPISPSLPLPCVTVCHHISTGVYFLTDYKRTSPFKSGGGRHFGRLLSAEVYASAVVMLDTPCSEVV